MRYNDKILIVSGIICMTIVIIAAIIAKKFTNSNRPKKIYDFETFIKEMIPSRIQKIDVLIMALAIVFIFMCLIYILR